MRVTRYFLTVILLTGVSADAFAQGPSAENAMAAIRAYCYDACDKIAELSDVRVGKKLQDKRGDYWPVRTKATYRTRPSGTVLPNNFGPGDVIDIEWKLREDGFGGYETKGYTGWK